MAPIDHSGGAPPRGWASPLRGGGVSSEMTHRLALYHFVGEALQRPVNAPREVIAAWIASALQEPAREVLALLPPPPTGPLSERLAQALLQLDTTFAKEGGRCVREFSAYIVSAEGSYVRVAQRGECPWDELPANVREEMLRDPRPVEFRHWQSRGGR
jgi:hypothetical protein